MVLPQGTLTQQHVLQAQTVGPVETLSLWGTRSPQTLQSQTRAPDFDTTETINFRSTAMRPPHTPSPNILLDIWGLVHPRAEATLWGRRCRQVKFPGRVKTRRLVYLQSPRAECQGNVSRCSGPQQKTPGDSTRAARSTAQQLGRARSLGRPERPAAGPRVHPKAGSKKRSKCALGSRSHSTTQPRNNWHLAKEQADTGRRGRESQTQHFARSTSSGPWSHSLPPGREWQTPLTLEHERGAGPHRAPGVGTFNLLPPPTSPAVPPVLWYHGPLPHCSGRHRSVHLSTVTVEGSLAFRGEWLWGLRSSTSCSFSARICSQRLSH